LVSAADNNNGGTMFLINGQKNEFISVQDRGLHYGDGLFETLAVHDKQPLCWGKHFARLKKGCARLGIECPSSELLFSEAIQLCNDSDKSVLKIILTRGQGGRGYRPPETNNPVTRILGNYPWPDHPHGNVIEGIKIRLCNTRLARNPQLAGIKHLNRLEQVLARSEWDDPDVAEGLMQDTEGNVMEGTMSNLFIINGNLLITPDLTECGIAGIIRECVLDLAADINLETSISSLTDKDLYAADEIFLCNSVIGIWPVRQLEQHQFRTGPWTGKIREKLVQKNLIAP
jgi:4-amino-4-deoxychorismate lyase